MSYRLSEEDCKKVLNRLARLIYEYVREHGIKCLVTGSSGGLDSAVTLALVQMVCALAREDGIDLLSVGGTLPCHSNPIDLRLGRLAIQTFGAREVHYDLSPVFDGLFGLELDTISSVNRQIIDILLATRGKQALNNWEDKGLIAQGNIKARLRMIMLFHFAKMLDGVVMSTSNLSEFLQGFWTLDGDVGDIAPLEYVLKGLELYPIAEVARVPQEILDRPPTDGLGVSETSADQLGGDYPSFIDPILISLIQRGFDPDGAKLQLQSLPEIKGFTETGIHKVAKRSIDTSFKRRGTITFSREQLGLPPISEIEL